ncbi:hypothetical protein [Rahnella sp. ChDrAdgB13]|uniref:hypothetical protein n=1 Tax=Rahnella sp. ChDrAdgB13 TaxID=1850581 RepID=UPI001AD86E59|nr:hypothetical protein [Rahnella sp. ChDrAdgB13]
MSAPRRTRNTVMKSIRVPHETDQIISMLSQQRGESWAGYAKNLLKSAAREALNIGTKEPR